jgi:Zn-dependent metalloprotease
MSGSSRIRTASLLWGALALAGCGIEAEPADALAELTARTPVAVTLDRATGAPQSIYGPLSAAAVDATAQGARGVLAEHADALRIDDVAGLAYDGSADSPIGTHHRFRQTYRGVPVEGGEVQVHQGADGRAIGVTSSYVAGIALPTVTPTIDAAAAVAALRRAERALAPEDRAALAGTGAGVPALLISVQGGAARLVWRVIVPTEARTWQLDVDAADGAILAGPTDINRYATGQVWRAANAVVALQNNTLRDNNNSATAVPSSAYQIVTLQGLAGTGLLDGTYASSSLTKKRVSSAAGNFVYDRSNIGFEETLAYYYIDLTERYIQSLGFSNINNRQQVYSVNGTTQDNSFYSPSTKKITYGTGGVDDAEDAEVIIHEYGHSIQDNQVPGFGSGSESGAQGEAFGDSLGATIGAQTSGGFQDTCIMEWDATSYSSTNPPCLRRLDTAKHYPESVVGEVHADGEIWSGALWNIRVALGAAAADKVILQHHFLLPANPSFNTAANALVTAAKNLGYTSAQCGSVKTALVNRGFAVTAVCP